jgi:hypothetical protein
MAILDLLSLRMTRLRNLMHLVQVGDLFDPATGEEIWS